MSIAPDDAHPARRAGAPLRVRRFPHVVKDVSGLLGPKLVVYVAGVTETRAVRHTGGATYFPLGLF